MMNYKQGLSDINSNVSLQREDQAITKLNF